MKKMNKPFVKVLYDGKRKSSIVWKYFGKLELGEASCDEYLHYCNLCFQKHIHSAYKSFTGMRTHLKTVHKEVLTQEYKEEMIVDVEPKEISISNQEDEKMSFAKATAMWLCTDLLSFSVIEKEEFKNFLMSYENEIGKNLPNSNDVKKALNDIYISAQNFIKEKVASIPKIITLQLLYYTNYNHMVSNLTIAIKYVNNVFELETLTLGTKVIERPHSSIQIGEKITEVLSDYGLDNHILMSSGNHDSTLMNLPGLITNCSSYIDCIGHSIHLIFTSDLLKCPSWIIVQRILKKVKASFGILSYNRDEIITHFPSSQNKEIFGFFNDTFLMIEAVKADEYLLFHENIDQSTTDEAKRHQTFEEFCSRNEAEENECSAFNKSNTRWYLYADMVNAYLTYIFIINLLLVHPSLLVLFKRTDLVMNPIEIQILIQVKIFFDIIRASLSPLQHEKEPSSHYVIVFHNHVLKTLESKIKCQSTSDHMKLVYEEFRAAFIRRIKIHDEYLAAAFLDPLQVYEPYLKRYFESVKETPYTIIKKVMKKYIIEISDDTNEENENNSIPAKRARLEISSLIDRSPATLEASLLSEFTSYSLITQSAKQDQTLGMFWFLNKKKYPTLFKTAKAVLSISPILNRCKQNFSSHEVLRFQNRVTELHAQSMLFIHDNLDLIKAAMLNLI
ncbi:CLUMA_CG020352, isoform A [Clunio marinus]|uniref:CLUMA_CG020352, isoform A n=1 Tax=Clunio marinus TaxID=568069 RepID=A0A1J1J4R3_9DIPT|nr:CLUMA_CG020352, isoform A [Clunio marinus]